MINILRDSNMKYCIAIFLQYYFKGSMTKKKDNSNGCRTDLKYERTTQRSPKTGTMI